MKLAIHLPGQAVDYDIVIEDGIFDRLGPEIQAIYQGKRLVILTDANVDHYYGQPLVDQLEASGFQVLKLVMAPGEDSKHFRQLEGLYQDLIDFQLSRGDLIIALGGGVIGDLAGYLAATYLRGVDFVQIPTSLLAQVDSSVGGKVAVDLDQGKNLVGAFYHPLKVFIDPKVLETLEDKDFADGMAEVIKYGAIFDVEFFKFLEANASRQAIMDHIEEVLYTCCQMKAQVVREDERDTGRRMVLNFGHTLGHAIEAYYNYDRYTHGQGVAIGMVTMAELCQEAGLTPAGTSARLEALCQAFGLPTQLDQPADYKEILPLIKSDKKNLDQQLHIIILEELGQAVVYPAKLDFFQALTQEV